MVEVRAVGGGLPELGPWRLQSGEEGEGLRAFGGCLPACLLALEVEACLSRGKIGSFGVLRAAI